MSHNVTYNMIVAMDLDNGIGKDNSLPWHFSEDLKRFSKLTKGEGKNAIIMGKNTWNSIPITRRPLKNRDNLILSTSLKLEKNSPMNTYIKSFTSINALDSFCEEQKYDTVWIIGGQLIYEQFSEHDKLKYLYITLINNKYNCDTTFPMKTLDGLKLLTAETEIINNIYIQYQIYENEKMKKKEKKEKKEKERVKKE
jgi:dihydrofolate reductase